MSFFTKAVVPLKIPGMNSMIDGDHQLLLTIVILAWPFLALKG